MSDAGHPIVIGETVFGPRADDCGCCSGDERAIGAALQNRPGLPAIAYRIGTHASFAAAMRARLSSAAFPALKGLRSREEDDFSIALLDGWATLSDVLTFYQERIANESYLRTATERLSVVEQARLIGYRARPGVAASVDLAFTLEEAPGAPEHASKQLTLEPGVRVQSIPGPGQQAQAFETIEGVDARLEWNAMRPLRRKRAIPVFGSRFVYLAGAATQLKPGDAMLLVGDEQIADPDAERWDFRVVAAVEIDHEAGQTRVEWEPGLGSENPVSLPAANPRVFALRLRASLFGYNAPHPDSLHQSIRDQYGFKPGEHGDWPFSISGNTLYLDNLHPTVVAGSWLVLSRPAAGSGKSRNAELYRAARVAESARADYAISGKSTRIELASEENLTGFAGENYRGTTLFAQSEELPLGEAPVAEPAVHGDSILVDGLVGDPGPGRTLIVRGKRALVEVKGKGLTLAPSAGGEPKALSPGARLTLLEAPKSPWGAGTLTWRVRDEAGDEGALAAATESLRFIPAGKDDETIAEAAELKSVENSRYTRLVLASPLAATFDLFSCEVLGNVVRATHGETVSEILGNGDAGAVFQSFTLKQTPLTYVADENAAGAASTLEVRVGDILWREAPALYGKGAAERVYATRMAADGKVTVEFGDGRMGARLPSGQNNVRARYRKGIGAGGLVDTGQLSLLLSRPLGVKSVINPLPATGAADPDSLDQAREGAPLGVLTLDRAVSLRDYEDFARGFAGIGKALATWAWDGRVRRVVLTVAGADGAEVPVGSALYANLLAALGSAGDPFVSVIVKSYRPAHFGVALKVRVAPDYVEAKVLAGVEAALRTQFSFAARRFGQPVAMSEVIAAAQSVTGIVAIDLDRFHRTAPPFDLPPLRARLPAALPEMGESGTMLAAELLRLDPGPLERLESMP